MREIKRPSAFPYYGAAAAWLIYALLLPMYRLSDYLIFLAAGFAAYCVLKLVFRGAVERVKLPVETGDPDVDALLREGEAASAEMEGLRGRVKDADIKTKLGALISVIGKIFADVSEDAGDYRRVRRFADFYLPTIMKLLRAYERFEASGGAGETVVGTLDRISDALDSILASCEKQYDALFRNQALDIETDVVVLEQLLKKDGLTDSGLEVSRESGGA
jgi:hypothetical protein